MTILTLFSTYPLGNEGFGLNGNILETNILNLAVVITILVSFGGDALSSLLKTRKETILKNFEEAKIRSDQARDRILMAGSTIENAKEKAIEIAKQSTLLLDMERQNYSKLFETEVQRLLSLKNETLSFQEQRIKFKISNQIIQLAIQKVEQIIRSRLTPRLHDSVNNVNILVLGKL